MSEKTKVEFDAEISASIERLKEISAQEKVSMADLIEYYEHRYRADKARIVNTSDYLHSLIDNGNPEEEFRNEHMRVAISILDSLLRNKNISVQGYYDSNIVSRAYDMSRILLKKFENKHFREKKDE